MSPLPERRGRGVGARRARCRLGPTRWRLTRLVGATPVAGCRGVGSGSGMEGGGDWIEGSLAERGLGDARGTSSLGGGGG